MRTLQIILACALLGGCVGPHMLSVNQCDSSYLNATDASAYIAGYKRWVACRDAIDAENDWRRARWDAALGSMDDAPAFTPSPVAATVPDFSPPAAPAPSTAAWGNLGKSYAPAPAPAAPQFVPYEAVSPSMPGIGPDGTAR